MNSLVSVPVTGVEKIVKTLPSCTVLSVGLETILSYAKSLKPHRKFSVHASGASNLLSTHSSTSFGPYGRRPWISEANETQQ